MTEREKLQPLEITVVIPAFNAEAHIARAIQSALDLGVSEIVVVDDGSSDATAAVARNLGCRVLSQTNRGAALARLAGVALVVTPFLVLLDADDELNVVGFRNLLASISPDVDWSGLHGNSLCIASDGSTRHMGTWPEGVTLRSLLARGICPGPAGSFLWKTEALSSAISMSLRALWPRFGEDYEMLLRVAMSGEIKQNSATVCNYTLSGGKSAVSPFRDNVAAERVRRYYARLNGIEIRERRLNEIKGMAHLRDAYALPGAVNFFSRSMHLVRAACSSPSLLPRLLFRKFCRVNKRLLWPR